MSNMTIKEVARMAGVSPAAVSRYFNGGSLGKDKQLRIRNVVEKTGFRPNPLAQTMRTGRSGQIGVIVPKIQSDSVTRILKGISDVIREENCIMILGDTEHDEKQEVRLFKAMQDNHVDGIILMSSALEEKYITMIQKEKIPVVLIGESIAANRFNSVNVDCRASAVEMVAHLVEVGHRTIALLKGHDPHHETEEMSLGYQNVLRANGIPVDRKWIMDVENTIEGGYIGMKRMLAAGAPDAIFCTSDEIAYGAMEALKDSGMSIPEDVAVAGFGNNRMSNLIEPKLTTVELPYRKMGIYGARILFDLIEGETDSRDPRHILLQSRLRIRRSCGHQERIGEMF